MTRTVHGIIRGMAIELAEDLGVSEGKEVEVQVAVIESAEKWGEGITRSAGALANDLDWDGIMEDTQHNRKLDRRPPIDEK